MKAICLFLVVALTTISIWILSLPNTTTAKVCVSLMSDLSYGMTDKSMDGPIHLLQNYLFSEGYLKATPNGYFGSGTLSAIKSFQGTHSINTNGNVGPLTRAALKTASCGTVTNTTTNLPSTQPVVSNQNIDITSPATGETLRIGDNKNIVLSHLPISSVFSLILEQPDGNAAGYVAISLANTYQYLWTVGKVYSATTQSNETIATGTYRVRTMDQSKSMQQTDEVSGWFTVIPAKFSAISVIPSSVIADGTNAVAIYGAGFDDSTIIHFDYKYGTSATPEYVSSDGKILIFKIPKNVYVGNHNIFLTNSYDITSEALSLSVVAP